MIGVTSTVTSQIQAKTKYNFSAATSKILCTLPSTTGRRLAQWKIVAVYTLI